MQGAIVSSEPIRYGLQPPEDLFELARSIRRAVERMVVIDEPHEELRRARGEIDAIAQRLEAIGRKGMLPRMMPDAEPGEEDLRPYYAGDATRWHYNPFHPPLELRVEDGVLRGAVNLGLAYEGPPGCVHGGFIAMLLDQLLGHANLENGMPALTSRLEIRYRRPTPLFTDLELEAWPPDRLSDRRCRTRGCIRAGGVVTAEAEGTFAVPDWESGAELPHLRGSPPTV